MNKINNANKFIDKAGIAKARYDAIKLISVDLSKYTYTHTSGETYSW